MRRKESASAPGVAPDYCFTNRRALEQLRRSLTKVKSPTVVPTLPDNVAGAPIVITDSLSNAEAQGAYVAPVSSLCR